MAKSNFNKAQPRYHFSEGAKSKGILDDSPVRTDISTKEGTVEKTPVNNSDIANKKYVDDEIDGKIDDGTASGQMAFWNGTKWVKTETSEIVWDDTNKRLGIGTASPTQKMELITSGTSPWTNPITRGILFCDDAGPRNIFVDNGEPTNKKVMVLKYENKAMSFNSMNDAGTVWDVENILTIHRDGNVGIDTSSPATSAKLELSSTTGALLLTRMTTAQRDALTAVNGMILYNTTLNKVQVYEGGAWASVI